MIWLIGLALPGQAAAAEGDLTFEGCLMTTPGATSCSDQSGEITDFGQGREVTVSPDGRNIYTAGQFSDSITVFGRDPVTGEPEFIESLVNGAAAGTDLSVPRSIVVTPDGRYVYVASHTSEAITAFRRDPVDGTLELIDSVVDGVDGVDIGTVLAIDVSPDGRNLYSAANSGDVLGVFRIRTTGRLDFIEAEPLGADGFELAVAPDGAHVYVSAGSSIRAYSRDGLSGDATFVAEITDGVGGFDSLSDMRELTFSPGGERLYAAANGDDAVNALERDPITGLLTLVDVEIDGSGGVIGLDGPWGLDLSPDGKYLYIAGLTADSVVVFAIDGQSGALTPAGCLGDDGALSGCPDQSGTADGLNGVIDIAISPDGLSVYGGSTAEAALAHLSREPDTTAPVASIDSGPGATTEDSTPTFGFSSDDPGFGNDIECRLDAGAWFDCETEFTTDALAEGPHRFRVRASDTAGNVQSPPAISEFEVVAPADPPDPPDPDLTAPDTAFTEEPDATLVVKVKNKKKAKKAKAKVRFEFEASEDGSTFECRLDSGDWETCSSPVKLKLKKGDHRFRVRAIDEAGNTDFSPDRWQGTVKVKKQKAKKKKRKKRKR